MNPDSIKYRLTLIGHWLAVFGILLLAVVTLPLAGLWWLLTAGGPVWWLRTWQDRTDELQLRAARARIARKAARPPSSTPLPCELDPMPIVKDRYGEETRLSKQLRASIKNHN